MGQPYVGEIRMFAGNFAPAGWMLCQGQLLPISENETLFNLIGTTYGGDGQSTFALPDLQSRIPIHQGQGSGLSNYVLAQTGGVETVTLTTNQIPAHTHPAVADGNIATGGDPTNTFPAATTSETVYTVPNAPGNPAAPVFRTLNAGTLPLQGGSQPHSNIQPILALNFIISLFGIFPSQN
jgi:microcystin-dependent protein